MAADPVLVSVSAHGLIFENPPPVFILLSCLIGCLVPLTLLTINKEIKHYIENEGIAKIILGVCYILWMTAAIALILKINDTSLQVVPAGRAVPIDIASAVQLEGYAQVAMIAFIVSMCAMCALSIFGITPNFKKRSDWN